MSPEKYEIETGVAWKESRDFDSLKLGSGNQVSYKGGGFGPEVRVLPRIVGTDQPGARLGHGTLGSVLCFLSSTRWPSGAGPRAAAPAVSPKAPQHLLGTLRDVLS